LEVGDALPNLSELSTAVRGCPWRLRGRGRKVESLKVWWKCEKRKGIGLDWIRKFVWHLDLLRGALHLIYAKMFHCIRDIPLKESLHIRAGTTPVESTYLCWLHNNYGSAQRSLTFSKDF
jgi:hypothetical protein